MLTVKKILHKRLFRIRVGRYDFQPGIVTTIVTLLLLYVLISLGNWQTRRAEYKEHLTQQLEQRQQQAPVELLPLLSTSQANSKPEYTHVLAHGQYQADRQVLLDNRTENEQPGYEVYTPLKLANNRAILIDRGWVKQARTRQQTPDTSLDDQHAGTVDGTLLPPPAKGLVLGGYKNRYESWPVVVQYLDMDELSQHTGLDFYPYVIRMLDKETNAYVIPAISFGLPSTRHRGYAFQWYMLALTLAVIYLVVNSKRKPHD